MINNLKYVIFGASLVLCSQYGSAMNMKSDVVYYNTIQNLHTPVLSNNDSFNNDNNIKYIKEINKDGYTVFAYYKDKNDKINTNKSVSSLMYSCNGMSYYSNFEQYKPINYDVINGINDTKQPLSINKKSQKRWEKEVYNNKQAMKKFKLKQQNNFLDQDHFGKPITNSKKHITSNKSK